VREVIQQGDQSTEELFFRIVLFKLFNKIETWQLLLQRLGEIRLKFYRFERLARCGGKPNNPVTRGNLRAQLARSWVPASRNFLCPVAKH
jgi:hypothetical protein